DRGAHAHGDRRPGRHESSRNRPLAGQADGRGGDAHHPARVHDDRRRAEHGLAGGCVALDEKGFVKTGAILTPDDLSNWKWPLARAPQIFETSLPSVFAVGDVRSGSMKRVASAVGEGSTAISLVHQTLAG